MQRHGLNQKKSMPLFFTYILPLLKGAYKPFSCAIQPCMGVSVFRKHLEERPLISSSKSVPSTRIDVQFKRNLMFRKGLRVKQTICRTSIFFWTGVGNTDARRPETLAFSVGQTTAEAKASIWICFWNGTRTVSAGQSIS